MGPGRGLPEGGPTWTWLRGAVGATLGICPSGGLTLHPMWPSGATAASRPPRERLLTQAGLHSGRPSGHGTRPGCLVGSERDHGPSRRADCDRSPVGHGQGPSRGSWLVCGEAFQAIQEWGEGRPRQSWAEALDR